jgi:hypothetical protein
MGGFRAWVLGRVFGNRLGGNFKYDLLRTLVFSSGSITVLGLLWGFGRRLAHHPASSLELVLIPLIGLLLLTAMSLFLSREEKLNLIVVPSDGPAAHLLLVVRNMGRDATFSAFGRITGHPNGANAFRKTEFRLGWGDGTVARRVIHRGETERIFIASFIEVIPHDLSQMDVWQVVEDRQTEAASFRWNVVSGDPLPSFTLILRITAHGIRKQRVCVVGWTRGYTRTPTCRG